MHTPDRGSRDDKTAKHATASQPMNDEPAPPAAARAAPTPAPRWVGPFFAALTICLVPWIFWLAVSLPTRTQAHHWRLASVGLDIAEAAALTATAWFAVRRYTWIETTATATATLLVIDAWFDCTTADSGWPFAVSLLLALTVELPLAALSLWIARHAERIHERNVRSRPPARPTGADRRT